MRKGPGVTGLALALVAAVIALWHGRLRAHAAAVRQIAEIAGAAGFEPFGNRDDPWMLMFRSASAMLKIAWDRGYAYAEVSARRGDTGWVDDDLLRQVLLGEAGDPNGTWRQWRDVAAFTHFLRDHLVPMAAAVTSGDPRVRDAIETAARMRSERLQRWLDRLEVPLDQRSSPGQT